MSMMLNLTDRLLAMGRQYQTLGLSRDAFHVLKRLSSFPELPTDVAEETQVRLAELHLLRRRFRRARRCLTAALRWAPDNPRYHFLMATAIEGDDKRDPQRAADHYRRSLELDPEQPEALARFGQLLLTMGQRPEGIEYLRRAVELSPHEPEWVGKLAAGLRLGNDYEAARMVLREALFRNSRDARFRQLWFDHRFQEARREQEAEREQRTERTAEEPVILPFVRLTEPRVREVDGRIIRKDAAVPRAESHTPRLRVPRRAAGDERS